jgi:Ca2+-binding RTX toxin-like protein
MATATDNATLRNAIQNASATDPFVGLTGAGQVYSVLTLGKRSSTTPAPIAFDGYTVQGSSATLASSQELLNTRIYQQNVDSAFAPGLVKDLTLNYTSGGAADNGALLSMASTAPRSIALDNLLLKGVHKGWNGNGNLYMSLRSFSAASPLATTFSLSGSAINITGQNNGFQSTFGVGSGGSAFIHNWNNNAVFTLSNNNFDEAGYLSSFNLLNYSTVHGSAVVSGNTFRRSANANIRWEGNRLQNVVATLTSNTFQDGSYIDLYGNVSSVTLTGNTFSTIADGYGIRASTSSLPVFSGTNSFSGPGLALKNTTLAPIVYSGSFSFSSLGNSFTGPTSTTELRAGTSADDTLTGVGGSWLSGDGGNDTINGSSSADIIYGGSGDDLITSLAGADWVNAGDGNDIVTGGTNNDTVTGGLGADRFNWTLAATSGVWVGDGTDIVTDFSQSQGDQIGLSGGYGTAGPTPVTTDIFLNTATNSTLAGADFANVANLASLTGSQSNKVVVVQSSSTSAALSSLVVSGLTNAYVLMHDTGGGGRARLFWDADWSTTGTSGTGYNSNRVLCATYSNLTTLAQVTSLTASQFFGI